MSEVKDAVAVPKFRTWNSFWGFAPQRSLAIMGATLSHNQNYTVADGPLQQVPPSHCQAGPRCEVR